MAIIQSYKRGLVFTTRCDHCGRDAVKTGAEPGDAAEAARKEGFAAIPNRFFMPMKWACPSCKEAIDKDGAKPQMIKYGSDPASNGKSRSFKNLTNKISSERLTKITEQVSKILASEHKKK